MSILIHDHHMQRSQPAHYKPPFASLPVTDGQTEAPFAAGLATSTEEHLPIFALSGSDVGKIVIGKVRPAH